MTFRLAKKEFPYIEDHRTLFFSICGTKPWEKNEIKHVAFVVLKDMHYFVVVLDSLKSKVYVYGRENLNGENETVFTEEGIHSSKTLAHIDVWKQWSGPDFWEGIHALFGWGCPRSDAVSSIGLCWFVNGYDCGPEASFVLETLLKGQGLATSPDGNPSLPHRPCGHLLRLKMAKVVFVALAQSYKIWLLTEFTGGSPGSWKDVPKSILQPWATAMADSLLFAARQLEIEKSLVQAENHCRLCSSGSIRSPSPIPNLNNELTGEKSEVTSNKFSSLSSKNVKLRAPARRKRHAEAPVLSKQRFIPLAFDLNFDQYNQGPTVQDKSGIPSYILDFPTNPHGLSEDLSHWASFCDYGFRLDKSFALSFNTIAPCQPLAHYLPIGGIESYENENPFDRLYSRDISHGVEKRSRAVHPVAEDGIIRMGLGDMIQKSGEVGSNTSFGIFVQGKDPDDRLIFVDVEKDSVQPLSVHVSIDIDSVIWVTHQLSFKRVVKIHTLPYVKHGPPIAVHNHMTVNILLPQTDIERANGTFPHLQRFKLSAIPHTHFAQLGEGLGSTNVYVFFPRMIHKQEGSPYWATSIPVAIQNLWLSQVIYPCLKGVAGLGRMEYLDHTLNGWQKQTSTGSRSIPLMASQLLSFQESLRNVVREDEDSSLAKFGSFFFVLDCRGIKLWTKDGTGDYDTVLKALEMEFPELDLPFMADRNNGECVLDLGVSFSSVHTSPLVGLWSMRHSNASFAKSGSNAPKIHSAGTLAYYGGLQAEYPRDRLAATHLVFRSAYNLYFETIRRGLQFCEDSDAYEGNRKFKDCMHRYIKTYEDACTRSYGVREELRASLTAVSEIVKNAREKAIVYASSGAMVWIPSDIWFTFWIRRIKELERYQLQIICLRPPNLGILTSIIMYMFRTIFTSTERVGQAVKSLLYDIHLQEIGEHFGLFFLHTLESQSASIPELPAEDPEDLMRTMAPKKRRKAKITQPNSTGPSLDYPLGDRPTWDCLCDGIKTRPMDLIREPDDEDWISHPMAAEVFIHFTRDYWSTLREKLIVGDYPNPQTVEEAMRVWSVDNVMDVMMKVTFSAVRAVWSGLSNGRLESSFEDRFEVFFPPPEHQRHHASSFSVMWSDGYIHMYHMHLKKLTLDHRTELQNGIKRLLDAVQCLPSAARCTEKNSGRLWGSNEERDGIEMLTNPKLYKIKGINKAGISKAVRIMASKTLVRARIKAHNKGITVEEQLRADKKKKNNKLKSGKARNYRKPPVNRHSKVVAKVDNVKESTDSDDLETSEGSSSFSE